MTKIMIISLSESLFHKDLSDRLLSKDVEIERFVINNQKKNVFSHYKRFNIIINLIRTFLVLIKTDAKIINLHFVDIYTGMIVYLASFFKSYKIILTFYGSDYYRTNNNSKKLLEKIIKKSDKITFTNESTKNDFNNFYKKKYKQKLEVIRFGLTNLEIISSMFTKNVYSKNKYNISKEKIVICCGYNANKEQQHEQIINEINKIPNNILKKCVFLFPMAYGFEKELRTKELSELLRNTNLEYIIMSDYLTDYSLANLRLSTDIMINLQTSDQLSGSMQEHIFAGNYIIAGDWLPYEIFVELGIDTIKFIDSFEKLNVKIYDLIEKIESNQNKANITANQSIIYDLSSWETNIDLWIKLYKNI